MVWCVSMREQSVQSVVGHERKGLTYQLGKMEGKPGRPYRQTDI